MATIGFGGGYNPRYGRDAGPTPPTYAQGQPGYAAPFGFFPQNPYPMFQQPATVGQQYWPPGQITTTSFAAGGRYPQPNPVIDPRVPAANLSNSTGGVGCEPGYNYFFPAEHTKIHVFRTGATPPWQLPPNFTIPFHALHVPTNTTIAELLKGFGANNPSSKKNVIFECHQGGNGRWYRGMVISGDQKDRLTTPIKDLGWDATRTGLRGGKPVVYLYVTKD